MLRSGGMVRVDLMVMVCYEPTIPPTEREAESLAYIPLLPKKGCTKCGVVV